MRRFSLLILVISFLNSRAFSQTTRPIPQIERMVIISIDGCRPDVLLRADCPNVRSLMNDGAFTFWARTTAVSITLPSHVSMLTGVPPQKHGIVWNEDLPLTTPIWPKYPTLFELAHNAGYTTALISGKGKFKEIARPGTVDWQIVTDSKDNVMVADDAVKTIADHHPEICFVHFPAVDVVGHADGWGSEAQIKSLELVDQGIGRILKTLEQQGLREHTAILVTADHGGAGRGHGPDDPRCRHIPWIIAGPGIRHNYDLTQIPMLEINTEDTFATACYFFGLKPKPDVDGKPIKAVLLDRELLSSN